MGKSVYLTIDDTPSAQSDLMTDFLSRHDIQATIFCRGDMLERYPEQAIRAVKSGQILVNHAYSHRPAGALTTAEIIAEISHTEELLDTIYAASGIARSHKFFRFPYIDRGDGDRLEQRFSAIEDAAENKQDISLTRNDKINAIQDYLRDAGFTRPYHGVTHPLYHHSITTDYHDALFTFSSCDWMMTTRHKGKWPYKTIEDLLYKIDQDRYLQADNSISVALFHDQEEISEISITLIRHMIDTGFTFLRV